MSSFGTTYLADWESTLTSITVTGISNRAAVQSELNAIYIDLGEEGAEFFKQQVGSVLEIIKEAHDATANKGVAVTDVYDDAAVLPLWGLLKCQTPLFVAYCDEIMSLIKGFHSVTNSETLDTTDATTTVSEWRDIFEACEECSTCAPLMDSDCGTPEPWKCKDKFFCVKQMWTYIAAGCLVAVVILMLMMTMK